MCFYDQNIFSCGDYRWGALQQRCNEYDPNREPCELKLVFRTLLVNEKCETCQEIEQWHQSLMIESEYIRVLQRQGSEYSNDIQSSREKIRYFEGVIEWLETRRREDYFDATGVYVGIQESPLDVTLSLSSPEIWDGTSSGVSGDLVRHTSSSIGRLSNLGLDSHHTDHTRHITEMIPNPSSQPAVLLTTPENALLILRTSDLWKSITHPDTNQHSALPLPHGGTKTQVEPSLVSYAREVSGIRPDIRVLLEGYNVLDTISHMTAEEINGAINLTEPRVESGLSYIGSINLDIPYHWISLGKMSCGLDIDVRRQILKLLSRILTYSNAIFDGKPTASRMALNEKSFLYEQLLGCIRTRRNFVRKLSVAIKSSSTRLSPAETQKKLSIYSAASFVKIFDLSTIISKLNIVSVERFFVLVICDTYRSLLDVLSAASWEPQLSSIPYIKQLARDRIAHSSIFLSPFPGLWASRTGVILWKPPSDHAVSSMVVLELSSSCSTTQKLGELIQLHQSLPRWPFFVAVWYCTGSRAQQRRIFRHCYHQLFDFVFLTFTDRLRKHIEVYAKMGLHISQTQLELFRLLADNRIGAFDTLPHQLQANRVDDHHRMRLLGLHSFELLSCVDSVFQDLVPQTKSRHSRQATPNGSENRVICEIPEKLDLKEEKSVRAGLDCHASMNGTHSESHEKFSRDQRFRPLDRMFAFSSRLLQAVGLLDPPLESGKVRVQWKCTCGRWIYDDFIELRPGAAKELEHDINAALRERPAGTQAHDTTGTEKSNVIVSSPTSSKDQNPKNGGPTKTSSKGYDPRPQDDGTASTIIECEAEGRWLLVCAAAKKHPTSLSQMDVRSITSDRDLFKQLKHSFSKLKGKGFQTFSLRTVKSIRFVQFELYFKDFVDIRKVPDIPPETRKEDYLYQPCDLVPPVGENLMAHFFHHPEDAIDRSMTCLRAPKKRKNKLEICPEQGTTVGWGIQIVEGWIISRIWLLALTVFLLGSLVFGVCWSVLESDVQGAFGVAAYMVGLLVLIAGSVQTSLG